MIAIYARQSVDKKDSISIETQIEYCKYECKGEKYKVYQDKGFSGKDINRPEFKEMLENIKQGFIKKVIVYRLDRISRSLLDFTKMIEIFKKYDVEFSSTQEKFDTSTPIGNAMLSITMVFAQLERETIQQRITDNYYSRVKKGHSMGGRTPFGFTRVKVKADNVITSSFIKNDEEAEILTRIFYDYAFTNKSLHMICKELAENGIKTNNNTMWNSSRLSLTLKNPIYVKADANVYNFYKLEKVNITNEITEFNCENGCYLYGKKIDSGRKRTTRENQFLTIALHKGFIDSDVFLRCQYRLKKNKQFKNSGKGTHTWLSGLTKCGKCGYAMTVTTGCTKEGKMNYYTCRGKYGRYACNGHNRSYKVLEIEDYVEEQLLKIINLKKNIIVNDNQNFNINKTNKYQIKIIEIDDKIKNLIESIENNDITFNKYISKRINELDEEKNRFIKLIEEERTNTIPSTMMIKFIDLANNWSNLSLEQKKNIIPYFIEKVLFDDNNISIIWKHDFINMV